MKIAIFTSGGDAPGMNACIRAIVQAGAYHNLEVIGIRRGYQGMIENEFVALDSIAISGIIHRGGTILGSARSAEFMTAAGRKKAYENLIQQDISHIVAIGGDGTFKGASIFMSEYPDIAIVGVPGTIDNDLYGTDFTLGYDTAINTAMEAIDKIQDTADAHNRLFFVEVMGRDAGFIALRTGIATAAKAILVPEIQTDLEELILALNEHHKQKKHACIVVVSEGDDAGNAFEIVQQVKGKIPYDDIRVTVLGHIQRGGNPTCMDRVLASRMGIAAVEALAAGASAVMMAQKHRNIDYVPFEKAIKHHQRLSPSLVDLMNILTH